MVGQQVLYFINMGGDGQVSGVAEVWNRRASALRSLFALRVTGWFCYRCNGLPRA